MPSPKSTRQKQPRAKSTIKRQAASAKRNGRQKSTATKPRAAGPRRLHTPKRIWYKPLTWRHRPPAPAYKPLPKARLLLVGALRQQWTHKKLFGGITLIYGILNLMLVRGISGSSDLSTLKSTLDGTLDGFAGHVTTSLTSFTYLLVSSGSGNTDTSTIYQSILLVVCSLAFIWALRQVIAGHTIRIRESFYQGMYPLIPYLLVFLLLGLQLLPLVVGSGLYSLVTTNGIAIHWWEKAIWIALFAGLALWSLRMITASIFATYITALPDMTPLRAYRSAKQLVYGRRLYIWRKLIFLPVALLLIAAVIEIPLILFVTPAASWTFFVLSMLALPVVHGYLYNLYREML